MQTGLDLRLSANTSINHLADWCYLKDNPMTEPLAIPIPEAARLSGIGRSTIYAEIKSGNLKIRKVGRRTIIAMSDLRAFLDSKSGEAP